MFLRVVTPFLSSIPHLAHGCRWAMSRCKEERKKYGVSLYPGVTLMAVKEQFFRGYAATVKENSRKEVPPRTCSQLTAMEFLKWWAEGESFFDSSGFPMPLPTFRKKLHPPYHACACPYPYPGPIPRPNRPLKYFPGGRASRAQG